MPRRRSVLRACLLASAIAGVPVSSASAYQADSGVTYASCPDVARGTSAPDTYGPWTSTTVAKGYDGLGGQDQIWGSDGADCLFGGAGQDTVNAGSNADVISGGEGSDQLQGGAGDDDIDALEGRTHAQTGLDTINAGDGDDDVKADDGVKDTVDCGPGQDRVDADAVDTVLATCEQRTDLTIDTPVGPADAVLFGDVDGDGRDDLVTVSPSGAVLVRSSDGVDAFGDATPWLTWAGATGVTLGDVDGDGDADLVGRTGSSLDVQVALSSGTAFAAPVRWLSAAPAGTLRTADVDGSGTDDLIVVQASGSVLQAYADQGAFNEIGAMATLPAGSAPLFGDVDGDGLADLVLVSGGRLLVRRSDAATFGTAVDWGAAPAGALAVGDADGDSLADVLVRGGDGVVRYLASTGAAFGPATAVTASMPNTYTFAVADVDGDGRADAVGRAGAAVAVRIGGATVPESDGDPWSPSADAPEDPDGPTGLVAPQLTPGTSMALAWSDDDLTDQVLQPASDTDPDPAHRCAASQLAYDRMRQSGATYVRFVVLWSRYLEAADKDVYRRGLRNAVFCAQRSGLTPYMTITSAFYDAPHQYTASPSPAAFGALVSAVVGEFYPLGVHRFSLWNEPNLKSFLTVSCSGRSPRVRTAALYRSLYDAGYATARSASANGAIVYLGELSEQSQTGVTSCGSAYRTSKMVSTIGFLQEVVGSGAAVQAHGVAWHAYQHGASPRTQAKGIGIYDVKRFQDTLVDLYHNGRLRTPSNNKPGLYITEFGYFNVPFNAHNGLATRNFWSEPARKSFLPQALDRAARASVRMFLFWQLNEAYSAPPTPAQLSNGLVFDTGMLSPDAALAPNGTRPYGKGPVRGYANPQGREAFCAVRAWAIGSGVSTLALASGC